MKRSIIILLTFLPVFLISRNNVQLKDSVKQGIRFERGPSWGQIKAKAKRENKYIFIDCFATWCGPCKLMDKEVYTDKMVGDYFNAHFICVRSQMDRSDNDDQDTKNWYVDAATIQKEYGVSAFPTFFFLSPKGKLVDRDLGYKDADELILLAKRSSAADFRPPYQRYNALVNNYQKGKKDYAVMPALIDTARILGQRKFEDSVMKDYINYLQIISEKELYSKINIKLIASFIKGSKSRFFQLFYPDAKKTDSIMGQKGYAKYIVDQIIQTEDISKFAHITFGGMKWSGPAVVRPEPDWQQLINNIEAKYEGDYGKRLVMAARVQWYSDQQDWANCAKWFTIYIKTFKGDNNNHDQDGSLNYFSDAVILKWSIDKEQIDAAIGSMKGVIERCSDCSGDIDTYANLLYKADRKDEAIRWEEKAWKISVEKKLPEGSVNSYLDIINKMKNGVATWPHYLGKDDQ